MVTLPGGRIWRALTERVADQYHTLLRREIRGECRSLLDLGCGRASPAGLLVADLERSVGVDLHEDALGASADSGFHHEYVCSDVLSVEPRFGAASFDCVTALDLIEHLTRAEGFRLLESMERMARRKVIVYTPNGWLSQTAYDENQLQEHLSGWSVEDFRARGYRVYGVHGWRPLRGERARIRWRPRPFWTLLSLWSQRLTEGRPEKAFQLLCVKDL